MRAILLLSLVAVMTTAAAAAERSILVHGHRGARSVLPENTIPAFEHAIKAGADLLELDIQVTKDNVPVVVHDAVINATICKGPNPPAPVRQLTLSEVRDYDCGSQKNPEFPRQRAVPGTRIPTLDEVLALAPRGNFHFNIEIKMYPRRPEYSPSPEKFAGLVLDAIRRHKLEKRVVVQSFDFRPLHAMKKLAPEIPLAALYSGEPKDFVAIAKEAGAGTVAPQYNLVTGEQVKNAHDAGLKVVPWTANDPEAWRKLVDAGVDAIITDDPAELIAFLRRRG